MRNDQGTARYGVPPVSADDRSASFFAGAAQRRAVAAIGRGLDHAGGVVVLTGEAGAGKTALACYLGDAIDGSRLVVGRVDGASRHKGFATAAAQAFGLEAGAYGEETAVALVDSFLKELAGRGRRGLLIVDDAHLFSPAWLARLGAFLGEARPRPLAILTGRPELTASIRQAPELKGLRRRVAAWHSMDGPGAPAAAQARRWRSNGPGDRGDRTGSRAIRHAAAR